MSTGSLYARILRADVNRNTVYPWNRRHAPPGSDTSSDQFAEDAPLATVGTSSTNFSDGSGPNRRRQRWRLLSGRSSRRQKSLDPAPLDSNRRRISIHCFSVRRAPRRRLPRIASSSASAK
jgi:hypothetical protein